MIFAQPHFLGLLPIAPILAFWNWRRHIGGSRRGIAALCRVGCLASLTLALARPMLQEQSKETAMAIAIDLSPGMRTDSLNKAVLKLHHQPKSKIIAFSNRAEQLRDKTFLTDPVKRTALLSRLAQPLWPADPQGGGSALADALQLAGSQIPDGSPGVIELLSSALPTRGDAEAEAFRLARRGISVVTDPSEINLAGLPTAIVRSISAPASARIGQTISATVTVESAAATHANLLLWVGGSKPIIEPADLRPGLNEIHIKVPLHDRGLIPLNAQLQIENAAAPDGPLATISVEGPAQILVICDDSSSAASTALQALLGESARVTTAAPADLQKSALPDADVIVLADVPADHLTTQTQQQIRRAVMNGTGLLLTGAARSFGPGGYDSSALAQLLPVRTPQQMQKIDPSTTLVLIIDTSGSMGVRNKLELAKEVSRLAISHLRPSDKVGIVEFYGGRRWAAPIQPLANGTDVTRSLNRLTAGGGTKLFPAFEEAAFALHNVQTRTKHVMILSDGDVEDAPFDALARQMAEDGIVVSTVACSPTEGTTSLRSIAQSGRGHYFLVPDEFELPDISLKQPQTSMLSPMVDTRSELIAASDPLLATASGPMGTVDGYIRTVAKPTADVLLKTSAGDPLLARWRCGAGWAAAIPTQLGSTMTTELLKRPEFAQLISGLFRQISRDRPTGLVLRPTVRSAGVEVNIAATETDPALSTSVLLVSLLDATGAQVRSMQAEPVSAGNWNVLFSDVSAGAYRIEARAEKSQANGLSAIAVPKPRAVSALTPGTSLIQSMTGMSPLAAEQAAKLNGSISWIDLQGPLIVAAVLLLLLNILARRWRRQSASVVATPTSPLFRSPIHDGADEAAEAKGTYVSAFVAK